MLSDAKTIHADYGLSDGSAIDFGCGLPGLAEDLRG